MAGGQLTLRNVNWTLNDRFCAFRRRFVLRESIERMQIWRYCKLYKQRCIVYTIVDTIIYTNKTRKRGKAQRVACRHAQTQMKIFYLLTDWLCYCRVLNYFKKPAHNVFWPCVHSATMQMSKKISKVTGPKFTKFLSERQIIVDVSAIIGVAIFTSTVECQWAEWRRAYQFSPTRAANRLA